MIKKIIEFLFGKQYQERTESRGGKAYTKDDLEVLMDMELNDDQVSFLLKRSEHAIYQKRRKLGLC